ncbi:hypothetical protein [Amycolatopsis rubida]|nr:hypothetical protein [Amycolatopsis rubida]
MTTAERARFWLDGTVLALGDYCEEFRSPEELAVAFGDSGWWTA